jgi:hypothetical protein
VGRKNSEGKFPMLAQKPLCVIVTNFRLTDH